MRLATGEKRKERADLQAAAKPQHGVDTLKGAFARPVRDIPGVIDTAASRIP